MFYIDTTSATYEAVFTLGETDTTSPPPLAIVYERKGTNETITVVVDSLDVTSGERYVTIADLLTSVFSGTGQYNYYVYDYTTPSTPVELESGLCIVTADPITKTTYGTDKERGEYKGHL